MKHVNFLLLLAILLAVVIQSLGNLNSVPVESEDNNTSAKANTIETGGAITGSINNIDDYYDYFTFTIPSDGQIEFEVVPSSTLDAYLDLYDWNGESFMRTSYQHGDGVMDTLAFENLKAGTYFIRVAGGGQGSYTLSNMFTPTSISGGNDAEPNNLPNQAVAVVPNNAVTGHLNFFGDGSTDFYDYYTVTLSSDGQLSFVIIPESTLDAYLDLYDWNGESFLRTSTETGTGINDTLIFENLKAGTYYLRIGGGGYGSYTLKNVFSPTAIPDGNDIEPNDSYGQAIALMSGSPKTGHVNYFGDGSMDYYDWYSFSFSEKSDVVIRLVPEQTLDGYVELFNANTQFLGKSTDEGNGQTDTFSSEELEAGTYYVKVGGEGYGSYTLTVSIDKKVSSNHIESKPLAIFSDQNGRIIINNVDLTNTTVLEIYNLDGKRLLKEQLSNTTNSIAFTEKPGLYIVRVGSVMGNVSRKVVIR
jgi:hypothetical protein